MGSQNQNSYIDYYYQNYSIEAEHNRGIFGSVALLEMIILSVLSLSVSNSSVSCAKMGGEGGEGGGEGI